MTVERIHAGRYSTEESVPAEWDVGDVLLDLYEVTGILGEGDMGKVYQVHHRGWDLNLAVKSPRADLLMDEAARQHFVHEVKTWVALGLHPHTVSCHYIRTLGGIPRIFAENVEGGSLREWIHSGKLYVGEPEDILSRVLDIAIQMAWGLHHAHQIGLFHHDVKPGNVLMAANGTARMSDFGLARAWLSTEKVAVRTQSGVTLTMPRHGAGTPEYASPEQVAGRPLLATSDMWSWAVSVVEMLTGQPPGFGPEAPESLLHCLSHPDQARVRIPPGVADLLLWCFQIEPEGRPQNLHQVALALRQAYQQGLGQPYLRHEPGEAEIQADGMNNRAVALVDLGKRQEAKKLLVAALGSDAHHLYATHNLGLLLWRGGRLGEGAMLQQMREAREANPGGWEEKYLMGWVHVERGDETSVRAALGQALREADGGPAATRAIAQVEAAMKAGSRLLRQMQGHHDEIYGVAITPDGRFFLSGSSDGTVRLWDQPSGRTIHVLWGHTAPVAGVCLSPDGRIGVSASADATLRVWDLKSPRCLRTLSHGWSVRHVAITADGATVAAASMDKTISIWDVASGQRIRVLAGHRECVLSVTLTGDGKLLASASEDGTLRLWKVETGECLGILVGHTGAVNALAMTADGRWAISGGADRTLRLWNLMKGECVRVLEGHTGVVKSVALSQDAWLAVSAGATGTQRDEDHTVRVWELETGRSIGVLKVHSGAVNAVACTADGTRALSGSSDATLAVWAINPIAAPLLLLRPRKAEEVLATRKLYTQALSQIRSAIKKQDWKNAVSSVVMARNLPGYQGAPEIAVLWSELLPRAQRGELHGFRSENILREHTADVRGLSAPGWTKAVSSSPDGTVQVWDLASELSLRVLRGFCSPQQRLTGVAMSVDGRLALAPAEDNAIHVWDLASGKLIRSLVGHEHWINAIVMTPDSRLVASASCDGTVRLWALSSGRCLQKLIGGKGWVWSVAQVASGRMLAFGNSDGSIRVWDTVGGRPLKLLLGHHQVVSSLSMTPDGRLLVSGGMDKTIRIWELSTGACLRILEGHSGAILSVSLTADGKLALSASEDRTMRLWDVATSRCLQKFEGHSAAVNACVITPDARQIVSAGEDQTLRVWHLDWNLIPHDIVDWDDNARPCLETFLSSMTKPGGILRKSQPVWTDADFKNLMTELGYWGYGWLRPEGVQQKLREMSATWDPPAHLDS